MSLLVSSFWRAAAYCLHPRVIWLSLVPVLLLMGTSAALAHFYWQDAIGALGAFLESSVVISTVWAWLDARITDGVDNANNRFVVAAAVNRIFGGAGPFWGCPAGTQLPGLHPVKTVDYAALGLSERRGTEALVRRAQPVWKLYTTGSVGSQSLMGLPLVHRLSQAGAAVWPFDAADARVVLAEVYPSLLAGAVAQQGGIKDQAQVRLLASALWRLAQGGGLSALLRVPDGPARTEEGWILGAGHTAALEAAL